MTEEELFYNDTNAVAEVIQLTRASLYNLLHMLYKVPGVTQLGMYGSATTERDNILVFDIRCSNLDHKQVYMPRFKLVDPSAMGLLREQEVIKTLYTVLKSIGMADITSGNPLAQEIAFSLLTETGKFEDLVKLNILYPIVKNHVQDPNYITEERVVDIVDPFVGRVYVEPFFRLENTEEPPECLGNFEEGVVKPWEGS